MEGNKLSLTGRLRKLNEPSSSLSPLVVPGCLFFFAAIVLGFSLMQAAEDKWLGLAAAGMLGIGAIVAWRSRA
jgi:hypothetical protein